MKKIIISESAKNKIFVESMKMDAERKKSAIEFRKQLANQLKNGNYEYDSDTRTITIDGFKYNIDKTYAETIDGEPIPLHYTLNTVKRLISEYLGEDVLNGNLETDEEYGIENIYEIKRTKGNNMKKIRLNENEFVSLIENTVNEILDTFSPAEKGWVSRQMAKRGHNRNARTLDAVARAEAENGYYAQDEDNTMATDLGAMADSVQAPITARMKLSKFGKK